MQLFFGVCCLTIFHQRFVFGKFLGKSFEEIKAKEEAIEAESAEQAVEAIPETLLVFCGLNQALLTQVLEVIRVAKIPPIQLKAMLTDTNKEWDTIQLVEELRQEKAELEKGQN